MAQAKGSSGGEGLSLQTLIIAAAASAVAAVVTSLFWKGGTVVTAAMTPVIVSVVKEGLARPIQSDVMRRSATSARRVVAGGAAVRTAEAQRRSPAVGTIPTPPPPRQGNGNGDVTQGDVLLTHPRRTYGGGGGAHRGFPLRGRPLKVAIVTGLLAFVVAAVVLTVPELVFGGAMASGHSTTLFGGGSSSKSDQKKQDQNSQSQTQTQTTPQSQTPTTTSPSNTTPQTTPTQPQQTPAPQSQTPPPSGGATPAPQSPAPAAPSP